jgi:uncharacterized protein (TIGR01615 family)
MQLLRDVRQAKQTLRDGGAHEDDDVPRLTLELERLGYDVLLRESVNDGPGTNYLTNLRHQFAYVAADFSDVGARDESRQLLIEFNLRQQFSIASPTERFAAALSMVPDEFVGTKASLMELISLLSFEVEQAFKDRNMCLPPWRQARSLLSKWFPVLARDEVPSVLATRRNSAPCQVSNLPWLQLTQSPAAGLARIPERTVSCPLDDATP